MHAQPTNFFDVHSCFPKVKSKNSQVHFFAVELFEHLFLFDKSFASLKRQSSLVGGFCLDKHSGEP
jgi:hypothetical protein